MSTNLDPVIYKFRSLFPDKSVKTLTNIFVEMTNSVYGKTGAGGKGKKDGGGGKGKEKAPAESAGALERWGNLAANLRSMNLIEFKIAMYRYKSAGITFEEIRRIFIALDTSGNGRVELDEFLLGVRVSLDISHPRESFTVSNRKLI
jgi:hypothetical protein